MTIVPQDAALFEGTLRFNLDPFGICQDDAIINLLQEASLWDKFVAQDGLATTLSPSALSAGERQILALCRASLQRRCLVCLDEATSSVDRNSEQIMERIVERVMRESTVITVAHRLETLHRCTHILTMDDGRIVESSNTRNKAL